MTVQKENEMVDPIIEREANLYETKPYLIEWSDPTGDEVVNRLSAKDRKPHE